MIKVGILRIYSVPVKMTRLGEKLQTLEEYKFHKKNWQDVNI